MATTGVDSWSPDSVALRSVATAKADIDNAKRHLREMVVAARMAGHSWTEIGRVLNVTRQAASERFACDEQVAKAWLQVEQLLHKISGASNKARIDVLPVLEELSQRGALDKIHVRYALDLEDARNRTVHGEGLTIEEAERVTEHAIPLVGSLYLIANPQ